VQAIGARPALEDVVAGAGLARDRRVRSTTGRRRRARRCPEAAQHVAAVAAVEAIGRGEPTSRSSPGAAEHDLDVRRDVVALAGLAVVGPSLEPMLTWTPAIRSR
jgi:hypothetical protein